MRAVEGPPASSSSRTKVIIRYKYDHQVRRVRVNAPHPASIPSSWYGAKLKMLLRKAAERTVEATWQRIGALLKTFTQQECANYFKTRDMLQCRAIMLSSR